MSDGRALSPEQRAIAGYRWLTTQQIADEMESTRDTVINLIRSGAFGRGNVTRFGREYRIRPEAWQSYKERRAAEVDEAFDAAS